MTNESDHPTRIIDAALRLAAERGWSGTSLADIAAAAGLPIIDVYRQFRSKTAILEAFHRRIDAEVLKGAGTDLTDMPRDRVFDTIMRRFDALQPHKNAVRAITRDTAADPLGALCSIGALFRSMAWMLEASGIDAGGPRGRLRVRLLTALYLSVFRVWLSDESTDMTKTMAVLDRRLRQAQSWLGLSAQASDTPPGSAASAPSAA
jgi:AcrR family transcriptional regulator